LGKQRLVDLLGVGMLLELARVLQGQDREQLVPVPSKELRRYHKRRHYHQQSGGNMDKSLS
jgi:hypothetical protein